MMAFLTFFIGALVGLAVGFGLCVVACKRLEHAANKEAIETGVIKLNGNLYMVQEFEK